MLNWLNNIYLFGLFLAAIPILIHFLTRKKLSVVRFPTIKFIDEIQKDKMRSLKLKQIILLILRMLIVVFFVLAFARPTLRVKSTGSSASHERTSVIILLDNSFSTSQEIAGIDIFTLEKNAALRIISMLKEGDELSFAVFNDDVHKITNHFTRGFRRVERILDTLRISFKGTNIATALAFAEDELKHATNANREIYIITDNRATGWKGIDPSKISFSRARVYVILFTGNPENLAVSSIMFPTQLIELDKPFSLTYTVSNHSEKVYSPIISSLFVDGERIAQDEIQPKGKGNFSGELLGYIKKGGLHSGFIAIDNDELKIDDVFYFSFSVPETYRVLLLGGSERIYLKLALVPLDTSSFFMVKDMDYTNGIKERLDNYDVILLSSPPPLPDDFSFRLKHALNMGAGLIIFTGEKTDLRWLGELVDRKISFIGQIGNQGSYVNLGRISYTHPIFQIFTDIKEMPKAEFYKITQAVGVEGVIAEFTNGQPAIFETKLGDGKCIIMTSSVEPSWSNLYITSFFVPFLQRACQYVAGDVARFDKPYFVGEPIYRVIEREVKGQVLILKTPNKTSYYTQARPTAGKLHLTIPAQELPGIYEILDEKGNLVDLFAVNVSPVESDLKPLEIKGNHNFIIIDGQSENLEKEILSSRFGKELWKTFLILTFSLMILELVISSSWRKTEG